MIVAGIDPGKTGAMVILYDDGATEVYDVPMAGKKDPAWSLWARQWSIALDLALVDMVVIEDVHSMPKQGVASSFKFGEVLGFVHGIVQTSTSVPIHWPTPAVWKRKMGLTSEGDLSREEARRLMPTLAPSLLRVKDHDRAEAGLLAYYGRKYL